MRYVGGQDMTARHDVDAQFLRAVGTMSPRPAAAGGYSATSELDEQHALELFEAQAGSRHLDFAARWMQTQGRGYYTIGSAGHESNAALARVTRPTDPALLHYRSGAFYLMRASQVPLHDGIRDVLRGVAASAEEPMAGGRHKVFGHRDLSILPQTSTIASHLPRALGVALAIERSRKVGVDIAWPGDAITLCSFGDASVNHSTAVGALNAAAHASFQGLPLPILFVCEDNAIGISVRTPDGWVGANFAHRAGLRYFSADGSDPVDACRSAAEAARFVRERRAPAFLHLRTVRFMGHAGSDVELAYRSRSEIERDFAKDPLLGTAQFLIDVGAMSRDGVMDIYEKKRDLVMAAAAEVLHEPQLASRAEVMAPLQVRDADAVAALASRAGGHDSRIGVHGGRLPEDEGPLTLAQSINRSLADVLAQYPEALVFGEDVARKGGVYGVTRGLAKNVGAARVFDTLLDEQTILGLGLGSAVSGLLPIPEIQYLAYLHNAEDQIRGEGASLRFFSDGAYTNPMVVRIAGYAYQKGFGGHFHNDNSNAVLRDIPGIVVASPALPGDAAAMLRTCVATAKVEGRVCVFLEPIALYHEKDLDTPGDGEWLDEYAPPEHWGHAHVPVGSARTHGEGGDATIVTFGNGVLMSLRVARRLEQRGIHCRVVDLRWLAPLPVDDILREADATGRVLLVDETRRSGGVSESVVAALSDAGFRGTVERITSADSFVPLGKAANLVLVVEQDVEQAVRDLVP